jgi:hypothetical protein
MEIQQTQTDQAMAGTDQKIRNIMKPDLEFVFEMHVRLGDRMHTGLLPESGQRGFVPVTGGEIQGPRLNGTVVPLSGGDWPRIRPDGVAVFNARYMLKASDGTLIQIKNRGIRHGPADVIERLMAKKKVDPSEYYMRLEPRFEAPLGPHEWLTRTVFVGVGDRKADHSIFRYWAVL